MFKGIVKHAEDYNQIWVMRLILNTYIIIRRYGVEKKIPYYDFIEYEDFIHDMCIKCMRNGSLEIVDRYWRFLFVFIEYNIEMNLPEESELLIFHKKVTKEKYDYNKYAQWDYIASSIFRRIDSINEEAIKLKEMEVVISSLYSYNSLFIKIVKSKELSEKQKRYIIGYGSYQLKQTIIKLVDKKADDQILTTYEPFFISESFEISLDVFLILFNDYTNIIMYLAKNRVLSTYELNNYVTLGRSIADRIDKGELIELVMKKIVNTMTAIGKHVAKKS